MGLAARHQATNLSAIIVPSFMTLVLDKGELIACTSFCYTPWKVSISHIKMGSGWASDFVWIFCGKQNALDSPGDGTNISQLSKMPPSYYNDRAIPTISRWRNKWENVGWIKLAHFNSYPANVENIVSSK